MLDIGLKNLRNCNPVHRVKPSEPLQPFLSTPISPKRIWGRLYQKGASKSSLAISSLGDIQQNGGPKNRGSGNVGYTSYYTSPNSRSSSLSNQEVNRQDLTSPTTMHGRLYGYPRMADSSIETVDLRDRGRLSGSSSNTSSSGPSPLHPPFSGGQIPPPHIMLKGWRANSSEKLTNHREGDSFYGGDDVQRDDRWRRANGKHGVRDGHLHRSEAFRSHGSRSRLGSASEGDSVSSWRARRASEDRGRQNDPVDNSLSFSPLKQSRNYRKIELQAEPALFGHRDEDEGSSDDERDSILSETTGKTSPGMLSTSSNAGKPLHMLGRDPHHHPPPLSIAARLELHGRRRNYSGPPVSGRRNGSYGYLSAQSREKLEMGGRDYLGGSGGSGWGGSTPGHGNTSPFGDEVGRYSPRRPNFLSRYPPTTSEVSAQKFYSLESLERSLKEERANGYCKLTIGERDDDALSRITSSRTGISSTKLDEILSKSSVNSLDYDIELPSPTPSSIHEDETGQRVDISGQDVSESLDTDIQLSPPSSPNFDDTNKDFRLPTRDSNSFLYRSSGSAKSPIEDIIAPPLNFDVDHATSSCLVNETISEEAELPTCVNLTRNDDDKPSSTITDRNSTESSDTGYTSGQGQSPGISERKMLTTVEEFTPVLMAAEPGDLPGQCAQGFPYSTQQDALFEGSASSIKNSQSTYSMRSSQISYASTDSIRLYVPMVFHKSAGRRESSKRSLVVVVCLVENSDSLIKVSKNLCYVCERYMQCSGGLDCMTLHCVAVHVHTISRTKHS